MGGQKERREQIEFNGNEIGLYYETENITLVWTHQEKKIRQPLKKMMDMVVLENNGDDWTPKMRRWPLKVKVEKVGHPLGAAARLFL